MTDSEKDELIKKGQRLETLQICAVIILMAGACGFVFRFGWEFWGTLAR